MEAAKVLVGLSLNFLAFRTMIHKLLSSQRISQSAMVMHEALTVLCMCVSASRTKQKSPKKNKIT